jgi:putative FmdB family regulatory protein
MPIYEYRCQGCGDEFETIQKFSDGPLRKCRKCGGSLEKLLSRSAFHLSGGGWYADGYKKGGASSKTITKESKAGSPPAAGSTSKDSGSSGATSGGTA